MMEPPSGLASSPASTGGETPDAGSWSGNIQYLLNISSIGLVFCVFLFLFVKLRSDHRRIPGSPTAKLLAVWHATSRDIARHCGADAAQFLIFEGGSFAFLLVISFVSLSVILPLNLFAGSVVLNDEFSKTTISHIPKGSSLLWVHFLFICLVVFLVHFGMIAIENKLKITRFRDVNGNLNDPSANSTAIFTIMISGLPKSMGEDRTVLMDYIQHRYPGKVYSIVLPMDLCALDTLASELVRVRDEMIWLVARIDSKLLLDEGDRGHLKREGPLSMFRFGITLFLVKMKRSWDWTMEMLGYTDERKLNRLRELQVELECCLQFFKDGLAPGAGVAFVVFKDIYTANKAIQDFRNEKKKRFGKFFSVVELRLQRNQWKVERAPIATDIYWNHLGSTKLSLKLRRLAVNTCLLLMLIFFSSPLALVNALTTAGRIINAEAVDNAQSWFDWVQSSSWFASIIFQFMPNVIIFLSMYIIIPSVLSYLSKFERHLTVSGEQRAALLKMACFFLVNIILLKAIVESSLESALLKMGRCYLDGEDCKRIENYMSPSFLSRSCLSSLAFLITSTFLGISFDLLAPIPWIKTKIRMFKKNDMLQLVPEQSEEYPLENQLSDSLGEPLIQDNSLGSSRWPGSDCINPSSRTSPIPKQKFDFAQYYAFNLTIFALTLIYSSFAPIVAPVGATYFGYRYVVDKYNFLFVYRVRGFPAGNDGRLMDIVLSMIRFCVDLFLLSMLLYLWVRGDSMKLQAFFTFGIMMIYKLLPTDRDNYQSSLLEGVHNINSIVDGPVDYEVFSRPMFDWDAQPR